MIRRQNQQCWKKGPLLGFCCKKRESIETTKSGQVFTNAKWDFVGESYVGESECHYTIVETQLRGVPLLLTIANGGAKGKKSCLVER